jgi:uncharacterized protein YuzE
MKKIKVEVRHQFSTAVDCRNCYYICPVCGKVEISKYDALEGKYFHKEGCEHWAGYDDDEENAYLEIEEEIMNKGEILVCDVWGKEIEAGEELHVYDEKGEVIMVKFENKNDKLYINGQKVVKAYESYAGWFWFIFIEQEGEGCYGFVRCIGKSRRN